LGGKRLELLKEAVAKMTRVAVLYDPGTPGTTREVKEDLPVAACALGLVVQPWEVRDPDGLESFFAALKKERSDGLYVPLTGALMRASGKRIAGFARKNRIPSLFGDNAGVIAGGLMYHGADLGGHLPARRHLRGQNPQKGQAHGFARRAVDEV
jgi:ABC-type uncharacterized transport system substrate-binding protein